MDRALGISLHTGWGACVVVGGSLREPQIFANEIIEILGSSERFCFHLAAEMEYAAAETWIARIKEKAVANAQRALSPLLAQMVSVCAIVAKEGATVDLREVLKSHPRLHAAEGFFQITGPIQSAQVCAGAVGARPKAGGARWVVRHGSES